MRTALALSIALALAMPARAADEPMRRFAVVTGASDGGAGRVPLRFATTDAREIARVLRRLGGVAIEDLQLVEEPDPSRLRAALADVAARADRVRRAGGRVEVFLYYSGHSDEQGLLLGTGRIPYAELRRALDAVPADVRVAILDSCASGAFTRTKGGVHRPPFLLDASSRVKGHAFLTSSAADEGAQESDRLGASFFTHALVTGLRGAADTSGDGVVTLNEAYQYAFRETLARTEATQGGPQHATYDIALVGSGDVVMTDLHRADAVLIVPESIDGRVFVRNAAGQLVAELAKARGSRIELALEEGRYDVRVAREGRVLAGSIQLQATAKSLLEEALLAPGPLEITATRGSSGAALEVVEPITREPASTLSPDSRIPSTWASVAGGSVAGQGILRGRLGFDVDLAVTHWIRDFVAVEFSAGYYRMSGSAIGMLPGVWTDNYGNDHSTWLYDQAVDDAVSVVPAAFTLKLALPSSGFRPYVLGGVGISLVHLDRRARLPITWPGARLAPGAEHLQRDDVYVETHCGVGTAFWLTRHGFATVEGRTTFGNAQMVNQSFNMLAVRVHAGVGVAF